MGSYVKIMMKLEASIFINGFLYFLKKVPGLKRKLLGTNYSFLSVKKALGLLAILYQMAFASLKGILLPLLAIALPLILYSTEENPKHPLTLLLVLYGLLRFLMPTLLELNQTKFILLKELKMPPAKYALAFLLKKEGFKLLGRTLGFLLLTGVVFDRALHALLLSLLATFIGILAETLHLWLFKEKRFLLEEHTGWLIGLMVLVMGGAYALFFLVPSFDGGVILLHPATFLLTLIAFGFSLRYILHYDYYMEAMMHVTRFEKMDKLQNAMADARVADVKMKESDFKADDLLPESGAEKEGFPYLHALFFKRHRKFFRKPILIKSALVLVAILILLGLYLFADREFMNVVAGGMTENYTMFVFLLYLLSNSNRETKAMFYHCDLCMLRYGFYRQPKALLTMFTLRVRRIVLGNLIPTGLIVLGLFLLTALSDAKDYGKVLPLMLLVLTLSVVFSVHFLFMYYIFQPYTSSMQVKSPAFSIINALVYVLSWGALQIRTPAKGLLPYLIVFGLLYVALALFLVYKKAPQTFRIK